MVLVLNAYPAVKFCPDNHRFMTSAPKGSGRLRIEAESLHDAICNWRYTSSNMRFLNLNPQFTPVELSFIPRCGLLCNKPLTINHQPRHFGTGRNEKNLDP